MQTKYMSIVELPTFISCVGKTINTCNRDELIYFLARNPEMGDIIPRTGGVRKIRWSEGSSKGKRGGLRVIYYFYNINTPLFLLTAYRKSEQENLTHSQEKQLSTLAAMLKQDCKQRSLYYEEA